MEDVAFLQFQNLERDHWWFIGRRRSYFAILERFVPRGAGQAVADVGCGVGGMLQNLRRFGEPAGIDSDLDSIRFCRRRGFARCLVGGAGRLPLRAASQDLVTLFDCLEHLEDDAGALSEVARVLKPGGVAFFSVPAYQFLYANNDRVAHHRRRYTRSGLRRKVERAGLEVVKATYVNVVLFPLILPAVLLIKLRERLLPRPDDQRTNLSSTPPRPLNALLAWIFGGEGRWLRRVSAPCGHSLALVARKPG
ncbi:MAG: class I SAM-dependent methyltransferase [Planctomycetes bacterium]|nr:class I SAM-dependent methyltransferase [Planctomycetota bacterium]